jgi:hypothetical protein
MLFIETNVFKSNLHTRAYENKGKTQKTRNQASLKGIFTLALYKEPLQHKICDIV